MDFVLRFIIRPRFVRYLGRCWENPGLPLDHLGHMSLWSLRDRSAGILAPPEQVYPVKPWEYDACDDMLKGNL